MAVVVGAARAPQVTLINLVAMRMRLERSLPTVSTREGWERWVCLFSQGNTVEVMDRRLRDYFQAGVQLVWEQRVQDPHRTGLRGRA